MYKATLIDQLPTSLETQIKDEIFNTGSLSLEQPVVRLYTPTEIIQAKNQLRWIAESLVQLPGLVICVGPSKVGKTSLMVKLSLAIAHGESFLESLCVKQKVLYICLEGGIGSAHQTFTKMGIESDSDLQIVLEKPSNGKDQSENLANLIRTSSANVIFIDSMMLWEKRFNENSYSEVYEVLGKYSRLANSMDVTIIFTHHSAKSAIEGSSDGALGSTAWFGAVDSKLQLLKTNGHLHLKIDHRNGESIEPRPLFVNHNEGTISFTGPVLNETENRIREDMLKIIREEPNPVPSARVLSVQGKNTAKLKVLQHLCAEGTLLRTQSSDKRGNPVSYSLIQDDAIDLTEIYQDYQMIQNWNESQMKEYIDYLENGVSE